MTNNKAKIIGITTTAILSIIQVTAIMWLMFTVMKTRAFPLLEIIDYTIPLTILSSWMFSQKIGEKVIIQRMNLYGKRDLTMFTVTSIASCLTFFVYILLNGYIGFTSLVGILAYILETIIVSIFAIVFNATAINITAPIVLAILGLFRK